MTTGRINQVTAFPVAQPMHTHSHVYVSVDRVPIAMTAMELLEQLILAK